MSGQNASDQRSFLTGKLGQQVASPLLSIVDDGIRRRGLGSRPFDGEGVQSRRTVVIDRACWPRFLHDAESARRRAVASTGNALRSYDSIPSVGPTNFYTQRGEHARRTS